MRLIPKFLRRLWCKHEGTIYGGPELDDLFYWDSGTLSTQKTKLTCGYCGKTKLVSIGDIIMSSNLPDLLRG